ncbi:K+-sensing histidine kinase KdpD [Paenibacillus qinlingensis]|uniref:K+-sensing histidine kinase KdpD n=1 Tax=Paenibacillus qinlingensis TaxID=1837343 RepID=A0ABU1NY10_9BACL|nr:K+-sensing histidine kinase KdpD [Paenibacillus qinlingensis]
MLENVKPQKIELILGVSGTMLIILCWVLILCTSIYNKQFEIDFFSITFIMTIIPACICLLSVLYNKVGFLIFGFVWLLPMSIYYMFASEIFISLIIPLGLILSSILLCLFKRIRVG